MKRLQKIDNCLVKISVWCLRLVFILTVWLVAVKIINLSFMLELGEKIVNVTNQMLVGGAFWGIVGLIGILLICAISERFVNGLMKIKRRRMQSV